MRRHNAFYSQTEEAAKYVTSLKRGEKTRWGGGEGAGLHSTFSHQLTKSENMM